MLFKTIQDRLAFVIMHPCNQTPRNSILKTERKNKIENFVKNVLHRKEYILSKIS